MQNLSGCQSLLLHINDYLCTTTQKVIFITETHFTSATPDEGLIGGTQFKINRRDKSLSKNLLKKGGGGTVVFIHDSIPTKEITIKNPM